MAKAYICEKCGRAFDCYDYIENDHEEYPRMYHAIILKYTDDLQFKKKYRDWYEKAFCAKCARDIIETMDGK